MATAAKSKQQTGVETVADFPAYQKALAKMSELWTKRRELEDRDHEIEQQLSGLPKGLNSVTAAAQALLGSGENPLADAAKLRQEQQKIREELEVIERAIELHHQPVRDAERQAERAVRQYHVDEQRELAEQLLVLSEERLELLKRIHDFESRTGVEYGAPWICCYSSAVDGLPPDFGKLDYFINELKQELAK